MGRPCGHCNATGKMVGFVSRRDDSSPYGSSGGVEAFPCVQCGGTGTDPHPPEWAETGRRIFEWRQTLDLSLREAAKRFSVGVVEWSRMEHGRSDPAQIVAIMGGDQK